MGQIRQEGEEGEDEAKWKGQKEWKYEPVSLCIAKADLISGTGPVLRCSGMNRLFQGGQGTLA